LDDYENKSKKFDDYWRQRENMVQEARALDKYLLLVAPGALILSFGVVIEHISVLGFHWILFIGWGSLILSIISVLASLMFSREAWAAFIDLLDSKFDRDEERETAAREKKLKNESIGKRFIFSSFTFCVIGLIGLSIFVGLNLNHVGDTEMPNQVKKEPLEKGANPPPPAKERPTKQESPPVQKPKDK